MRCASFRGLKRTISRCVWGNVLYSTVYATRGKKWNVGKNETHRTKTGFRHKNYMWNISSLELPMAKPPHGFLFRRVWVTLWYDLPTRTIISSWLTDDFRSTDFALITIQKYRNNFPKSVKNIKYPGGIPTENIDLSPSFSFSFSRFCRVLVESRFVEIIWGIL